MATERPRWRVNQQSVIGHALVEEGQEVYYTPTEDLDGKTNGVDENLSPLNDAAQAIVDTQERDHIDKTKNAARRRAKLEAENADPAAEIENADGLVPKRAAKGDTKTPKKAAKGKEAAPPADDADDPEDVG